MKETTERPVEITVLQDIAASLRELVTWTRVMAYPSVKELLETTLDSDEKRLVYHLLDGERTTRQIQDESGVNIRYVSEWGQDWERVGLARVTRVSSRRKRRRRLFDLADFGIDIPMTPG